MGVLPTGIVFSTVPLAALISLTVFELWFATHAWVPSEDTPVGVLPTGIVFSTVPLAALISLTVFELEFATQTWVPSRTRRWARCRL